MKTSEYTLRCIKADTAALPAEAPVGLTVGVLRDLVDDLVALEARALNAEHALVALQHQVIRNLGRDEEWVGAEVSS